VVRVMIRLTDMRFFAGMNEVYAEFFHRESLPSRATVTGSMGMRLLLVGFDVIAYIAAPAR
jgi:enamine deaminase RidA (YjgF/YER057c/UK114 family)